MKKQFIGLCFSILIYLLSGAILANQVEIIDAKVTQLKDMTWRFDVTLKHADSGWKHYANEWRIVTPEGEILGTRTLLHPHVDEQPFTRSLANVEIPPNIKIIRIIARDTVHGTSSEVLEVQLESKGLKKIKLNSK